MGKSKTISLAEIQNQFLAALKYDHLELYDYINSDNISPCERVEFYRTTGRSLHVSVLVDVYCVCQAILGNAYFRLIANNYYLRYPSESPWLEEYGRYFSGFIADLVNTRGELKEFSYLVDLSRLEWSVHKLHHCNDALQLNLQEILLQPGICDEDIVLGLSPAIMLFESIYPVADLWDMHQREADYHAITALTDSEYLCIYRENYHVKLEKLDFPVYRLLSTVSNNKKTLFEIAEFYNNHDELYRVIMFAVQKGWLMLQTKT